MYDASLLNCIGYAKRKAIFSTGQKGSRSKEEFAKRS